MFQNVTEWRKRSNETRANDLVRCSYPSLRIPLIKVEKLVLAFPRRGDKFQLPRYDKDSKVGYTKRRIENTFGGSVIIKNCFEIKEKEKNNKKIVLFAQKQRDPR